MIHLVVTVADTAELLATEAYGAGALLRWESSATVDGVYVEGGTEALVIGQFVYDVWDEAGTASTWYRTRISDAGGTEFSPYSSAFQPASSQSYLTLAQLRAFETTALGDEALLMLLNAAALDIVRTAGPMGVSVVHVGRASGPLLLLPRAAVDVTAIVENGVTLAADDYELSGTGTILRRLDSGTHPAHRWWGEVRVTFLPVDDLAARQRVQLALVRQDLTHNPGLSSQSIGTWSEAYATGTNDYATERAAILASLDSVAVGIR